MCLFGGGWGVMKAIELSSTSVYWHDFVFKFVMFFGIMAPLAYFMLAYNFIYKVKNLPKILLYFISSVTIVLAILSFAGVLKYVDAAIIDGVLYRNIIFWDYLIFVVYFFVYVFLGLIILFKKYTTAEGTHKNQFRYLIIGTALTFLVTGVVSVIFLLFNNFTYDWLGAIFLSIHLLIISHFLFIKPKIVASRE